MAENPADFVQHAQRVMGRIFDAGVYGVEDRRSKLYVPGFQAVNIRIAHGKQLPFPVILLGPSLIRRYHQNDVRMSLVRPDNALFILNVSDLEPGFGRSVKVRKPNPDHAVVLRGSIYDGFFATPHYADLDGRGGSALGSVAAVLPDGRRMMENVEIGRVLYAGVLAGVVGKMTRTITDFHSFLVVTPKVLVSGGR